MASIQQESRHFPFQLGLFLLISALILSSAHGLSVFNKRVVSRPHKKHADVVKGKEIDYKTKYIKLPVDHFSYANQDHFQLRYLIADQFWDPENGPAFFYTGNEGDIELFCNNTGFMWDIAPEFKALLVFAEHRSSIKSMLCKY